MSGGCGRECVRERGRRGKWGLVESFIGEEKVFVVNAVLYREPGKLDEYRGDVVR